MKNKITIFIGTLSVLAILAFKSGGPCTNLYFFKEGASSTMTSYNEDGKILASTKTFYKEVISNGLETSVKARQEHFDKKGKPTVQTDFTIRCANEVIYMDMKMLVPQQQMEAYKDMELTVEGNEMEYPANLSPGTTLKDANIKLKVSSKGTPMSMLNMSIAITNRKVEGKETVTTPAGTFECMKISENFEFKTLFTIRGKSINWYSPTAGIVKTESYKENGKLTGRTELTELEQ